MGLFDFNCQLVDSIRLALDIDHSAETVVNLLEVNAMGLLGKNQVINDKLIGIGITLSGSISLTGVVQLSSPLGWKHVPLKELLSQNLCVRLKFSRPK